MAEQTTRQNQSATVMYNAIWSMAGQGIAFIIVFTSSIILARWLGPEDRGLYGIILTTGILLADFVGASAIVPAISYLSGKQLYPMFTIAGHTILITFTSIAFLCTIFLIIPESIIHVLDPRLGRLEAFVAIAWASQLLMNNMLLGILTGLNRIRTLTLITTSNVGLALIFQVVLLVFLDAGLQGAIVQVMLILVWVLILFMFFQRQLDARLTIHRDVLWSITSYTGKNYLNYVGSQILARADIYFITIFVGPAAAGIYIIARGLAEIVSIIDLPITQAVLPQIIASDSDEAAILTGQAFAFSFWGSTALAVLGASTSFIFIPLLYGSEFADSVGVYIILLIGSVALSSRTIHHYFFASLGKPQIPMYVMVSIGLLSIPTYWILTSQFGTIGAAMGYSTLATLRALIIGGIFLRMTSKPIGILFKITPEQVVTGLQYTITLLKTIPSKLQQARMLFTGSNINT